MVDNNTLWLLSFYRTSEISGALFFGRLARTVRDRAIQQDLTKHFADESQHAWYWTRCIGDLGARPLALESAYQDRYLSAAGVPSNLMEVLALTQAFECRVIRQYAIHSRAPGLQPEIRNTLLQIMEDEKWHIQWIRDALARMAPQYGADAISAAQKRFRAADAEVYQATLSEHSERVEYLFNQQRS